MSVCNSSYPSECSDPFLYPQQRYSQNNKNVLVSTNISENPRESESIGCIGYKQNGIRQNM